MKYKVGDRVRIKSLDWYNENKDKNGEILCGEFAFLEGMKKFCSKTLTILEDVDDGYLMLEDYPEYMWTDEMIEGLVEEEVFIKANDIYNEEYSKGEYCHEQSFKWGFQEGYSYSHENDKLEISLKDGYQFKDENGNVINATKIILEKKKNEYPKTYEECCKIIDYVLTGETIIGHKTTLLRSFQKLLICRDAYWKIAGEKMGLGKPWEPDWGNPDHDSYPTITRCGGKIIRTTIYTHDCPFAFPTPEMRDAFYENFKELIETVKELL